MTIWIVSALLIFTLAGMLFWVNTKIKSKKRKILYSFIAIAFAIIIQAVSFWVIGGVNVMDIVTANKNNSTYTGRTPVNSSKEEAKEVFNQDEVVRGNGIEISITNTRTVKDGEESEFLPEIDLCVVEFKLKNIYSETQTITSFDINMEQANGGIIYPNYFTDQKNKQYEFSSVTLQPNKEVQTNTIFDCQSASKPVKLVYKGGEFLEINKVSESDNNFVPIKFNLNF